MHEIFCEKSIDDKGEYKLVYAASKTQKGDIFTKELDSVQAFRDATHLIGMRGG